jgi:hypothetical protein
VKIIKLTPWLLAGAFGMWCVLVWVFGNEWKALFVYYPLYPWCILVEHVHKTFQAWLIVEPRTATGPDWLLLDRVHGLLYFVSGVVWYFFRRFGNSKNIVAGQLEAHQSNV